MIKDQTVSSQTKKITLDTGAIFFGKFLGLLFGMVRLNYLATYLGISNFGLLNFANFFCSLFLVLFDLGVSQLLTRELSRDVSKSREYVGKITLLKLLVVFVAGVIVGITAILSHFDNVTNWSIFLTTSVFAVNGVSVVFLSAFQAHRKMVLVSVANILNDLLLSIAIILILSAYPYLMTVLILSLVVAVFNLGILLIVYIKQLGLPHFKFDATLYKIFIKESTPFAISSFGITMYMFIGATVLKYSRGNIEVGIYSAGYKLISIFTLIPTAFTQVVYPIFSDFYINAKEKLAKSLSDSIRVMPIISIPLIIGTIILAPKIFLMLFPQGYSSGIIVLQVMIVGISVGYLNWIFYTFLLAINRQTFGMLVSIGVGISVSILSIIFIPRFGYLALAFISVVTEVILFLAESIYLVKIGYHVFSLSYFIRPLIASIIMALMMVLLSSLNLFFLILLGIVIYLAGMYALRGFGEQEKEIVRVILSRLSFRKIT
jgi:O-antigen/teichoic acid export membrane protein